MIRNFVELKERLRGKAPLSLALVAPSETAVLDAVLEAVNTGWVKPIMIVMNDQELNHHLFQQDHKVIKASSIQETAELGAELLRQGEADLIMKGQLQTADFIRPLLQKEKNLIEPGGLLSHLAAISLPGRERLTLISDGGININPDKDAKEMIIRNAIRISRILGYDPPKVAVLSALEVVNPKIPSSVEAQELKGMAQTGCFGKCFVSGPLALDNALSSNAAHTKGLNDDPVAGAADVLIVPELVSGNILIKSFSLVSGYPSAGMVVGAKKPVILTSRADLPDVKVNSIALACFIARA
jgi:phosphate butyryltransferase